jgi:hypothetical protein
MHFADDGDCGSIYYFERNGNFYPLAVHVGSGILENRKVSLGAPIFLGNPPLKFDKYFVNFNLFLLFYSSIDHYYCC